MHWLLYVAQALVALLLFADLAARRRSVLAGLGRALAVVFQGAWLIQIAFVEFGGEEGSCVEGRGGGLRCTESGLPALQSAPCPTSPSTLLPCPARRRPAAVEQRVLWGSHDGPRGLHLNTPHRAGRPAAALHRHGAGQAQRAAHAAPPGPAARRRGRPGKRGAPLLGAAACCARFLTFTCTTQVALAGGASLGKGASSQLYTATQPPLPQLKLNITLPAPALQGYAKPGDVLHMAHHGYGPAHASHRHCDSARHSVDSEEEQDSALELSAAVGGHFGAMHGRGAAKDGAVELV